MPTAVSYPGVYIEEVSSGVRTIVGVATSITAFVGSAPKGPSNTPIRIQSMSAFERRFGRLHSQHTLGYAVSDFFANGGTDAIVVRILNDATATSAKLKLSLLQTPVPAGGDTLGDEAPAEVAEVLTLKARNKGAWANSLVVHVNYDTSDPTDRQLFNLFVSDGQDVEEHRNLSTSKTSQRFFADVLASESAMVELDSLPTWADGEPRATWRPAAHLNPFDMFEPLFEKRRFTAQEGATLTLATLNGTVAGTPFVFTPADSGITDLISRVERESNDRVSLYLARESAPSTVEVYRSLKAGDTFVGRFEDSNLVKDVVKPEHLLTPHEGKVPSPGRATVFSYSDDGKSSFTGVVEADAAVDGDTPVDADLTTGRAQKAGLFALEDADLFNLLCIPPLSREGSISNETYATALQYCLERRAMLIVDPRAEWDSIDKAEKGVNDIRTALGANDSKNASLFFPRIRAADPAQENRTAEFAPCGAVAGIFAKTDAQRGVWKAPAGIEAGIAAVREFSVKMTDPENGRLNQLGLNCLRNFPVYGNVVWGARTLAGADALASEHKYIPVRRLTLFIEESLYRGTQWVVFEPNGEPLWAQIRLNVGVFMQGLFRQGAFQGRTANEAFFVKCDKTTTTQADINEGKVNIDVGFAPLKPAEFVIIRIQQIAGDLGV